jgi:signal transduction histidine kinase
MKAPSEATLQLPWLCPCAASLTALARPLSAAVWTSLRHDPGAVLLLVRAQACQQPPLPALETLLTGPAILDFSLINLEQFSGHGFVDWSHANTRPLLLQGLRQAVLARRCAERIGGDPESAWIGGLLAPLGWYALAACDPSNLADADIDVISLTRRLTRLWRLPAWLAAVVGNLSLPVGIASRLGADPAVFQAVQLAVSVVSDRGACRPLQAGLDQVEDRQRLSLDGAELDRWADQADAQAEMLAKGPWQNPADMPLLAELLQSTRDHRRDRDVAWIERLQQEVDLLQQALDQQRAEEKARLDRLKLAALAELAAGAGHEINNPLAVISGQAQYVLKHLNNLELECREDPAIAAWLEPWKDKVARSLHTIVGQTQRIHHVLTDLMQFARPSPPKSQTIGMETLIREAIEAVAALARDRRVRVETGPVVGDWMAQGDAGQWRIALAGVVRNAIEAAPPDGWVGVRVIPVSQAEVEVVVEDNGPGPAPAIVDHLFDPFFSGRSAGRGRGLGLPTAWRLARQNAGDVRYAGVVDGRTGFVLRVPIQETPGYVYQGNGHYSHDGNGRHDCVPVPALPSQPD